MNQGHGRVSHKPLIVFDLRWVKTHPVDGISRYVLSLVRAFADLKAVRVLVIAVHPDQVREIPDINTVFVNDKRIYDRKLVKLLNTKKIDYFYSPFFAVLMPGRKFRLITTIHDLIPLEMKTSGSLVWRMFYMTKWPIRFFLTQADYVTTVSNVTASKLKKIFKIEAKVIPNAPFEGTLAQVNKNSSHTKKRLFYIGRYERYKRVDLIVSAARKLPEYEFVLAGRISDAQKRDLLQDAPNNVSQAGAVSDAEYQKLIQNSYALIQPSSAEGFGLQVVEAMAMGCPVVVSDIDVFKEIAGRAATYFRSGSVTSLVGAIKRLEAKSYREEKIKAGYQQAAQYTWKQSAQKLNELISSTN